jgi:hypothetical protein
MALPSSAPITLLQIYTEFGAPVNTPLTQMVRGGAYVPNSAANAGVPLAPPIDLLDFLGATDTQVAMTVTNVSSVGASGPQTATLQFLNNGQLFKQTTQSGSELVPGEWLVAGSASGYDVRWDNTSGSLSAGSDAPGVWLNLGTTRQFNRSQNSTGASEVVGTVQIRDAVSLAVLLTASGVTLSAEIS